MSINENFYINVSKLGNNILYTGIENGKRVRRKVAFSPTFYISSNKKDTKFRTLFGKPVELIKPGSIKEARNFLDQYSNVSNFEIYGMDRIPIHYIRDEFPGKVNWDMSLIKVANIDIEVANKSGMTIDEMIEHAQDEVTAITVLKDNTYYVFGCKSYIPTKDNVKYYHCDNEQDLLEQFVDFWSSDYPDVVIGWNIKFFDFPYLLKRLSVVFDDDGLMNKMSPWGKINARTETNMNKDSRVYDMVGIGQFDMFQMYRKFAPGGAAQESYKLNYIASVEVGEKKIDYSTYQSLDELYEKDYTTFIEYNMHDVTLVDLIAKKRELVKLGFTLAYMAKVNYDDIFFQVRMWDSLIYSYLLSKNIVIPQKRIQHKSEAYKGAAVKDPIIGKHRWTVSFDLKSLYPHLIMMFNISPDTFIDAYNYPLALRELLEKYDITVDTLLNMSVPLDILKEYNMTVTPNSEFFSMNRVGFLSEMMQDMYKDRDRYKKLSEDAKEEIQRTTDPVRRAELEKQESEYDTLQQVIKICLNSAYGAIGNKFFRFFDVRQASAVTYGGQLVIRWIIVAMNKYMNNLLKTTNKDYILASDTDSMYIDMSGIVDAIFPIAEQDANKAKIVNFLNRVCAEKLSPFIDSEFSKLAKYLNAINKMEMKREVIADKSIWVKKKHYALNIWMNEKVKFDKPKIKVKGLQMIKSSTPAACREKLSKAMDIIMNGTEDQMIEYISSFRKEFNSLPIEDIALPRGMSEMDDFADTSDGGLFGGNNTFNKGTPIHVKASLLYNKTLDQMKLKQYPRLQDGEKIKFLHLVKPNPFFGDVMGFPVIVPKEFNLAKYVDKDVQFNKAFLAPLKSVMDVIPWQTEKTDSLFD